MVNGDEFGYVSLFSYCIYVRCKIIKKGTKLDEKLGLPSTILFILIKRLF